VGIVQAFSGAKFGKQLIGLLVGPTQRLGCDPMNDAVSLNLAYSRGCKTRKMELKLAERFQVLAKQEEALAEKDRILEENAQLIEELKRKLSRM
jgi:hypothetical protein